MSDEIGFKVCYNDNADDATEDDTKGITISGLLFLRKTDELKILMKFIFRNTPEIQSLEFQYLRRNINSNNSIKAVP